VKTDRDRADRDSLKSPSKYALAADRALLDVEGALERMPLVTRDPAFALFGIETLW